MSLISRDKVKTELGKQLYDRLQAIWDDEEWLLGMFLDLRGDDRKKKFIKYLDEGETDTDRLTYIALDIADGKI